MPALLLCRCSFPDEASRAVLIVWTKVNQEFMNGCPLGRIGSFSYHFHFRAVIIEPYSSDERGTNWVLCRRHDEGALEHCLHVAEKGGR